MFGMVIKFAKLYNLREMSIVSNIIRFIPSFDFH